MAPTNAPDAKSQIEPGRESSFSNYMDKKIRNEQREKGALFGVQEKDAPKKMASPQKAVKVDSEEDKTDDKKVLANNTKVIE